MDGLSCKARVEKFDIENGMDAILVDGGAWLLFSNGARREVSPIGALVDPPANLYERARLIVKYHQTKLGLAVQEFNHVKLEYVRYAKVAMSQGPNCPLADDKTEAVTKLNKLKAKVRVCQAHLDEAHQNLEKHTPADLVTRRRIQQQNLQGQQDLLTAVEQIEV